MKTLLKIFNAWEKSLLILVILLAVLLFVCLFWPVRPEGNITQQGTLPAPPNYVNTSHTAFLEPAILDPPVNPMAFRRKNPNPPKRQEPPKPKPEPKKEPAPAIKPAPVQAPAPKKPAVPKIPPRVLSITYRGYLQGLQKDQVAFLRVTDSAVKGKEQALSLPTGGSLHETLTILSFDEKELRLLERGQRTITVPRNQEVKVNLQ